MPCFELFSSHENFLMYKAPFIQEFCLVFFILLRILTTAG